MKRFFDGVRVLVLGLVLSAGLLGCGEKEPVDQRAVAVVKSALERADMMVVPEVRIDTLCQAGDFTEQMREKWPESAVVQAFLSEYQERVAGLPAEILALSLEHRHLEGFQWAVERGQKVELSEETMFRFWQSGRGWRNYLVAEYPDVVLPVFMNAAVKERDTRFFDKQVAALKERDFRVGPQVDQKDFNINYCAFVTMELEEAYAAKDRERMAFLLDHALPADEVAFIGPTTKKMMRSVGNYICHELKDEALACRMVELGYDLDRVRLKESGFGDDFIEVLKADPEFAIRTVLVLDQWKGALSDPEVLFVHSLTDEQLGLVHRQHVDEAVVASFRMGRVEEGMRLARFRMATRPYVLFEFQDLMKIAIEGDHPELFDFVMAECREMNIYNIDLRVLAKNLKLFQRYAPQIFKRIYRTMERTPRAGGVTLGRIHDVLVSPGHDETSLWIIQRMKLQPIWKDITEGRTLLMDVCHAGNLIAAKYLVEERGADVQAHTGYMQLKTSLFGSSKSKEGRLSPIFFAAASGNCELIRYLVSKGAQVNDRSAYGATPLMYAVSENRLEAVKTLIELRASVNAIMNANLGRAQLMEIGSLEEVSTAFLRAKKNRNREIMQALVNAGARQ